MDMKKIKLFLLVIFCFTLTAVSGSKDGQARARPDKKAQLNAGQSSTKADVPTAEQILGRLLGVKPKPPDQNFAVATAPQTVPMINLPPQLVPSTSQARSPYKSLFSNSISLVPLGTRGATPQTEETPGLPEGYALPPPPNGYHYGTPRRKKPIDRYGSEEDEHLQDDGNSEEEPEEEEENNPADEEYHDDRNSRSRGRRRGRGRGRTVECINRIKGGCGCVCWKGIKPHVEWVKVPVCYQPCGVCCPKHEEQPSCACICHPCCHSNCCHCCHSCCCHHPCHCCHCCHCCRRSQTWRPPLAVSKQSKLKVKKQRKKKSKSKL